MAVGFSIGTLISIAAFCVFLWILFRSDLQAKKKRRDVPDRRVLQPERQRDVVPRRETLHDNTTSGLWKTSSLKKQPGSKTEFDKGRRTKSSRDPYLVSVRADTRRDREFLSSLNPRNNLDAAKVFVQQQGVPTLDLHGATTSEARRLLEYFLQTHRRTSVRVVTGRGVHNSSGTSLLRNNLIMLLSDEGIRFDETAEGGALDFYAP